METLDHQGLMLIADAGCKLPCKLEIHQVTFVKLLQTSTEKLFSEELQSTESKVNILTPLDKNLQS